MKTLLACLLVIAAAVWFGSQQRERIRELGQLADGAGSSTTAITELGGNSDFRTKSRSRPERNHVTIDEVFDEIMRIHNAPEKLPTQFSHSIMEIAADNSELLQKMSCLDAASLEQLIEKIHASPASKTSPVYLRKIQEISLCLIAMGAIDPSRALEILASAKQRFGDDQARLLAGEDLLSYIVTNLAKRDPVGALEHLRMLVTQWPGDGFGPHEQTSGRTRLYSLVARERPDLAVDAALQLPADLAKTVFANLGSTAADDSQRTALVNSLRPAAARHPDLVKAALQSIKGMYLFHQVSIEDALEWIGSLGLNDSEKLSLGPYLFPDPPANIGPHDDGWAQIEWLDAYLPASEVKEGLLREGLTRFRLPPSSPERIEFLKLHGIEQPDN